MRRLTEPTLVVRGTTGRPDELRSWPRAAVAEPPRRAASRAEPVTIACRARPRTGSWRRRAGGHRRARPGPATPITADGRSGHRRARRPAQRSRAAQRPRRPRRAPADRWRGPTTLLGRPAPIVRRIRASVDGGPRRPALELRARSRSATPARSRHHRERPHRRRRLRPLSQARRGSGTRSTRARWRACSARARRTSTACIEGRVGRRLVAHRGSRCAGGAVRGAVGLSGRAIRPIDNPKLHVHLISDPNRALRVALRGIATAQPNQPRLPTSRKFVPARPLD